MHQQRPGEAIDKGALIREIDFSGFQMHVSTERYYSAEYHKSEREKLWMRVWQVAGRADEIPKSGDWMEYKLFDQSWVLVRGREGTVRGFVNACRHRGNAFCDGRGHAARFTCPYHNWTYGLDGALLAVAKPDFDGLVEDFVGDKAQLGLVQVPVEEFAGFVFLNPDPNAAPLADYLGEIAPLLAPYHMADMIPVGFNTREVLDCNWKVVMDAFQEGYHIQAVHPELISAMDESKERYGFFGDHSVATGPFGAANMEDFGPEAQAESIRSLPATFPGVTAILPRFEELLDGYRSNGALHFPKGVSGRLLLQQATRDTFTVRGLDVSGLTDTQMSDNHFHLIFPNLFITIRAGEATLITSTPHPHGDPGRCFWHVQVLMWLPPEEREAARQPLAEITDKDQHQPYFIALEQDYDQMQQQQKGLSQQGLPYMALTRQEVRLAWYHAVLDSWIEGKGKR